MRDKFLSFADYALNMIPNQPVIPTTFGTIQFLIPVVSLLISLVFGATQTDYNPVKQTISQLVYYPYGWVHTSNFIVMGIWLVILGIKLYRDFASRISSKIASGTLLLMAIGFFLIAAFPTFDPNGGPVTTAGLVHEYAARSVCALFPIVGLLMIPELRSDRRWKKLQVYTICAAVMGIMLVVIGGAMLTSQSAYIGLLERTIMANAVVWVVIFYFRLFDWPLLAQPKPSRMTRLNTVLVSNTSPVRRTAYNR